MVVLSVSLLSKNGKVLVARQFVEMTRMRLEGLLAAFPKLVAGEKREHTYIDTESVRYVYQPLDSYFLVLIVNKTSNIVEDLHTLQLFAKVIPDTCGSLVTEDSIREHQFDLVFAFDEVLTPGGHSENINMNQIRTNLEMDSLEEKQHKIILENKRQAAKGEMKRQQQRIKEEQRERARIEKMTGGSMSRFGSSGFGSMNSSDQTSFGSNSSGGYGNPNGGYDSGTSSMTSNAPPPPPAAAKSSGMQLGGLKKGKNLMSALAAEDDLKELPPMSIANPNPSATTPVPSVPVSNDPVVVTIEEKMKVQMNREGSLELFELKGSLSVRANDQSSGLCTLQANFSKDSGISLQSHPKINKNAWENDMIIALKSSSKPFPENNVSVIRWGIKSQDENLLPLAVTCWPEEEDGKMNVTIEYNLEREQMELKNVDIMIPLGTSDLPQIVSIDGNYHHNPRDGILVWHLEEINSSNANGTLEFNVCSNNAEAFFPLQVVFYSHSTYCDVKISSVTHLETKDTIPFGQTSTLSADGYYIQ